MTVARCDLRKDCLSWDTMKRTMLSKEAVPPSTLSITIICFLSVFERALDKDDIDAIIVYP